MKLSTQYQHNFTKPWTQDEYIYIDGQPYVYTGMDIRKIFIRFPGGYSEAASTLSYLYGPGRVKYPLHPRLNHAAGVQNLNNSTDMIPVENLGR